METNYHQYIKTQGFETVMKTIEFKIASELIFVILLDTNVHSIEHVVETQSTQV